jgi:membrane protease YdiL (CAAX protease family)
VSRLLMAQPRPYRGVLHARLGVLLIASAGLVGLVSPLAGAAADGLLVAVFGIRSRGSAASSGLLLVPLLRLLWVAMPIRGVPEVHWIPLVTIPLLVVTLLVARSGRLGPADVGLRRGDDSLAFDAAVIGGWAVAGIALSATAGDAVAWGRSGGDLAWVFVLLYAPLVGFTEETAFRGLLAERLERTAPVDAMPLAVVAAATLAMGAGSPWWVAVALVTPVVSGAIVARSGSLLAVIAGHALFLVLLNL